MKVPRLFKVHGVCDEWPRPSTHLSNFPFKNKIRFFFFLRRCLIALSTSGVEKLRSQSERTICGSCSLEANAWRTRILSWHWHSSLPAAPPVRSNNAEGWIIQPAIIHRDGPRGNGLGGSTQFARVLFGLDAIIKETVLFKCSRSHNRLAAFWTVEVTGARCSLH